MKDIVQTQYQRGQEPPLNLDLDDWADEFRYLNETTGEKWFTDRVEIARGPMKAVTEQGVRTITIMCCTQLMKTELILNIIGYFVHLDPCPILVVQPKDDVAKKFSNVRLKQMINSTPVLKERFSPEKTRDNTNTTQHKEFVGGHISIVSAKSPSNLAMFSIRLVLQDEIDKFDESAGKEGDPLRLAEERMAKYSSNSLSVRVCSPTIKELSRIELSYQESDQRKPFVSCPHCDFPQLLIWKNVKWDKDDEGNHYPETAQYLCKECGVFWSEHERHQTLKNIDWRQTADFNCDKCNHINKPFYWKEDAREKWDDGGIAICEECGEGKCKNTHAGFWANKMYSPFRPLSEMAVLWLDALGNLELMKTFANTQLAETFEEPGQQIKEVSWLMDRCEQFDGDLPSEVGIITAGIDTQNNRLEAEIVGWGIGEESWSMLYKIIPGDPAQPETWAELDKLIQTPFYRADGGVSYIAAACIDMGGGHTQHVANYCRHRINRRIWPIRGVGGDGTARPVWPNNPSRGGKYDTPFYNIGVDTAKNVVFGRLLQEHEDTPGYCHFPFGREEDYFKQFTAERRVQKWKGARKILVWENPKKARNEAFDNRVYAYAALEGLKTLGWDLDKITREQRLIRFSDQSRVKLNQETPLKNKKVNIKSKRSKIVKSSYMDR